MAPQRIICVKFVRSWMSSSRIGGLVVVVPWNGLPIYLISHHEIFSCGGYIKSKVYGTRPRDLAKLEERIRNAYASVTPEMLSDVGQACVKRWLDCYEKGDAHVAVYH